MTIGILPTHSFSYDGARINIYHAKKGEGLPKHNHEFAHATFCTSGSFIIRKENKEVVVDKTTQPINLVEIEWHEIEALEDNTVFINVFADKYNA
jgi:quercetin dioxygenase-like cupin family protein